MTPTPETGDVGSQPDDLAEGNHTQCDACGALVPIAALDDHACGEDEE